MNANLQQILAQYNSKEGRTQEQKTLEEKRRKKDGKQATAKGADAGSKQLKSKLKVCPGSCYAVFTCWCRGLHACFHALHSSVHAYIGM